MDRPLVALATATTALRGAPHLVAVSAARVVEGEVTDVFDERLCPAVPIEPEATQQHGLDDDDVRDADTPGEVLGRFREWLGADWMAAHDAPREAEALGFDLARHDVTAPTAPVLCSLALARRFVPEADDGDLATLCEVLQLEEADDQSTLARAVYCWKVLEECARRAGGNTGPTDLLALCGAPVTVAAAGPRPARTPPRLRPLLAAVAAGAEVTLLYSSSAEAPARVRVLPLLVFERRGRGYLEAECRASGLLKTYLLERVRRVLD